ncbi:hypothetical protein D623_10011010 [Myotis brandtii]|uniref:Uncharacterized protein n=1 Tax=Myotis brandtii TaxID=109478 RepID=S7PX98_MYOBR|nr:hypothetical protein D623_10011010 [Myotis brandtii]
MERQARPQDPPRAPGSRHPGPPRPDVTPRRWHRNVTSASPQAETLQPLGAPGSRRDFTSVLRGEQTATAWRWAEREPGLPECPPAGPPVTQLRARLQARPCGQRRAPPRSQSRNLFPHQSHGPISHFSSEEVLGGTPRFFEAAVTSWGTGSSGAGGDGGAWPYTPAPAQPAAGQTRAEGTHCCHPQGPPQPLPQAPGSSFGERTGRRRSLAQTWG